MSPSTAAIRAHDHAIKNRLVCLNQKKYSRVLHVKPMCQHPCLSSSDHARVGERVRRGDLPVDTLTVTRTDGQRCDACKNGLVVYSR